jgi:hypothetical protein
MMNTLGPYLYGYKSLGEHPQIGDASNGALLEPVNPIV